LKAAGEDFHKPKLTEIDRDLRYFGSGWKVQSWWVGQGTLGRSSLRGNSADPEDTEGKTHRFKIVGKDEADVATGR
jgi:hypothetical protein